MHIFTKIVVSLSPSSKLRSTSFRSSPSRTCKSPSRRAASWSDKSLLRRKYYFTNPCQLLSIIHATFSRMTSTSFCDVLLEITENFVWMISVKWTLTCPKIIYFRQHIAKTIIDIPFLFFFCDKRSNHFLQDSEIGGNCLVDSSLHRDSSELSIAYFLMRKTLFFGYLLKENFSRS